MASVKIDLITSDPSNDEFVLYLVEDAPWDVPPWDIRMRSLRDRVAGAIDVVCLGLLASKYPESKGKEIRLQIDLHNNPPSEVSNAVDCFVASMNEDGNLRARIVAASDYTSGLRFVTRAMMGRI